MKKLLYVLTGLCLLAGAFTGCEEPNENNEEGGGTTQGKTGAINGVVTSKGLGELISMATVELLPTDKKTQTDNLGAFSFTDLATGTYRLRVSKQGYVSYTGEDITVEAGQKVYRAIVLEPEQTDLQILDAEGNELTELYLEDVNEENKGIFKLKNAGSTIVEWAIPKLAEEWLSFSKESGNLAPGASEQIELTIDRAKLTEGEHEAVVYVGSTAGTVQLKIRVNRTIPKEVEELLASMVKVKGGTFTMGCTSEQGSDCDSDESPSHSVTLSDYYIGQFEVTQKQWMVVMGTNLSYFQSGDDYPVESVSWTEAVAFCEKLSELTGKKYRLPTEAEWEYAARGGQNADGTKYAGSNTIGDVAWYIGNSGGETHPMWQTHPVGQKQPNGLGLYDMSGNVDEWCSDWYGSDYYSKSLADNPQGPSSGSYRVTRGGGGFSDAGYCRVSFRGRLAPGIRSCGLGLRVACSSK